MNRKTSPFVIIAICFQTRLSLEEAKPLDSINIHINVGDDGVYENSAAGEDYANGHLESASSSKKESQSKSDCECGVNKYNLKNRVVGGTEAPENGFPWQVLLIHPKRTWSFCGGSLISSDTVLTAAHCWKAGSDPPYTDGLTAVLGEHHKGEDADEQRIKVVKWITHPDNNQKTFENDFAILKLEHEADLNDKVMTICLPNPEDDVENRRSIVTGWGQDAWMGKNSEVLKMAEVRTMSNEKCINGTVYPKVQIKPEMICAAETGRDACQNDSGGPLVTKSKTKTFYEQIGVVSFGDGCAKPDAPGVYARVSSAVPWIRSQMTGTVCSPPKE